MARIFTYPTLGKNSLFFSKDKFAKAVLTNGSQTPTPTPTLLHIYTFVPTLLLVSAVAIHNLITK